MLDQDSRLLSCPFIIRVPFFQLFGFNQGTSTWPVKKASQPYKTCSPKQKPKALTTRIPSLYVPRSIARTWPAPSCHFL